MFILIKKLININNLFRNKIKIRTFITKKYIIIPIYEKYNPIMYGLTHIKNSPYLAINGEYSKLI